MEKVDSTTARRGYGGLIRDEANAPAAQEMHRVAQHHLQAGENPGIRRRAVCG
jgi:hypothetical protein